jgi:excisionase family DNA binding protein
MSIEHDASEPEATNRGKVQWWCGLDGRAFTAELDARIALARWPEPEPAPPPAPDDLKTPSEAARRLGISIRTLRSLVGDGDLRYINVGRGKQREHSVHRQ